MSLMSLSFRSSTSRSSASDVEAPAFTANCRRVHQWNLEDGAKVTLYQKGEQLQYQWKLHQEKIEGKLKTDGNVEEALENYQTSSPFRIGNKVYFVRPQASVIDPHQYITRDLWALTLVCYGSTQIVSRLRSIRTGGGIFGHSVIILEKIDEEGIYKRLWIHLTYQKDIMGIEIMNYDAFNPSWTRSNTYLQSAHLINQMIQHVLEQKQLVEDAYAQGTPLPFNYAEDGFREGTPDKNCHTFSVETLAIADVHIPLVGFRFPHGRCCYIPRYSVGPLDELCRKMVDQGYPIEGLMEEEKSHIQNLERSIKKHKFRVQDSGIALAKTLLIPGCQIVLPWILPITSFSMIYYGIQANKLEKRVKAIKVASLKAFYMQGQVEE